MSASASWSRLAAIAVLWIVLVSVGCGDLLQEPDTGFSKLNLRLEEVSGNGQTGSAGRALAAPVRVRILGAEEAPLPRLRIEWFALDASGTAEPRNTFSDEDGVTETIWILGPATGSQKLRAFVREGVFVDFSATAVGP